MTGGEDRGGAVRAALAALQNLTALLRNPRVGTRVVRELRPELASSCEVLSAAFEDVGAAPGAGEGARALAAFGRVRVGELVSALRALPPREDARGRLALERVVPGLTLDLVIAGQLLVLLQRAAHPRPTEVGALDVADATRQLCGRALAPATERPRAATDDDDLLLLDVHVVAELLAQGARVFPEGAPLPQLQVVRGSGSVAFALQGPGALGRGEGHQGVPLVVVLQEVACTLGGRLEVSAAEGLTLVVPVATPRAPT